MDKQLGFLIDTEKCIGCRTCEFACRNERGRKETHRRRVTSLAHQDGNIFAYLSMACNHCANPACMAICPERSIRKDRNGIVILNSSLCSGCGKCVTVCPFGAISMLPETGRADKCDMCAERQKRGELPICVANCIMGAISIIDLNSAEALNYQEILHDYEMRSLTRPSIRFVEKKDEPVCFWAEKGD
ncbi:4Fe-4S ferredoxin iron-sulfur binding domain protein [[Clostridium] ultunense Esp]|uniref:4Fe-4S dicluster domain-containing protein n=1 Tax=Thermicanus aegyptius TaxID=94009 RepID=UPI0002B6FA9B|nr:4Fe-4S dicluster domain-containing protein [Thermicanus aegyptius]CCQ96286.1 4Fe-4S ferredoxin iron-sulfur binding domain protein [[Clostridium] ultunense Esp]